MCKCFQYKIEISGQAECANIIHVGPLNPPLPLPFTIIHLCKLSNDCASIVCDSGIIVQSILYRTMYQAL